MSYTNIILFNRTLNNTVPVVQDIAQVTGGAFPDRAWLRSYNLRVVTTNGGKCMDGFWDFGLMDSKFSEIDIFAAVS